MCIASHLRLGLPNRFFLLYFLPNPQMYLSCPSKRATQPTDLYLCIYLGEYFTSGLFCLQRKHTACEYFLTFCFSRGGVVSASPNPASCRTTPCRLSATAYSIYSQLPIHTGGRSSIRNLRTRHDGDRDPLAVC